MYSDNDLTRFSPSCCGEQGYVVLGSGRGIKDFCEVMLAADAKIVAVGWEAEILRKLEARAFGSEGTLRSLPLPASPDYFEEVAAALKRMEVHLEGVVVCAETILGGCTASELFSLKSAEATLRALGRGLASLTTVYTGALIVFERPARAGGSPLQLRTLAESLVEALSGGFDEGYANVRTNALLAGVGASGAMHHLLYESFVDRNTLKAQRGFLAPL